MINSHPQLIHTGPAISYRAVMWQPHNSLGYEFAGTPWMQMQGTSN